MNATNPDQQSIITIAGLEREMSKLMMYSVYKNDEIYDEITSEFVYLFSVFSHNFKVSHNQYFTDSALFHSRKDVWLLDLRIIVTVFYRHNLVWRVNQL